MKTPPHPPAKNHDDPLQPLRERLARELFETEPVDPTPLVAHGLLSAPPAIPTPDQLSKPLQNGLKTFQINPL
ncbi:MAG: hypothetical protein HQM03_09890 [Magnetococcales bacterium]|nr:hypothetical protein [Magnetococcales bacterium]